MASSKSPPAMDFEKPGQLQVPPSRSGFWMSAALTLLTGAAIVSVSSNYSSAQRRREPISPLNLSLSEGWETERQNLMEHIVQLTEAFTNKIHNIESLTAENTRKIEDMTQTYMELQGALDEKDREIRRLKRGYDAEVFRKFLLRFIRIDQALEDYTQTGESTPKILEQLKLLFEDALDECGVEQFRPKLGEDYRRVNGVADNPKKVQTDKVEDEFMIAEVLEPGYQLRNGNGYEVIVPSNVKIFAAQGE